MGREHSSLSLIDRSSHAVLARTFCAVCVQLNLKRNSQDVGGIPTGPPKRDPPSPQLNLPHISLQTISDSEKIYALFDLGAVSIILAMLSGCL